MEAWLGCPTAGPLSLYVVSPLPVRVTFQCGLSRRGARLLLWRLKFSKNSKMEAARPIKLRPELAQCQFCHLLLVTSSFSEGGVSVDGGVWVPPCPSLSVHSPLQISSQHSTKGWDTVPCVRCWDGRANWEQCPICTCPGAETSEGQFTCPSPPTLNM